MSDHVKKADGASPVASNELLARCPFCGCDLLLVDEHVENEWVVICHVCEARGPIGSDRDYAVRTWNTRANIVVRARVTEKNSAKRIL